MARITSRSIVSRAAMSLPYSYFGNAFQASSTGISAAAEIDGNVADRSDERTASSEETDDSQHGSSSFPDSRRQMVQGLRAGRESI